MYIMLVGRLRYCKLLFVSMSILRFLLTFCQQAQQAQQKGLLFESGFRQSVTQKLLLFPW